MNDVCRVMGKGQGTGQTCRSSPIILSAVDAQESWVHDFMIQSKTVLPMTSADVPGGNHSAARR